MFTQREKELKKLYILTPEYFNEIKTKFDNIKQLENVQGLDATVFKIINNKSLDQYQKFLYYREALLKFLKTYKEDKVEPSTHNIIKPVHLPNNFDSVTSTLEAEPSILEHDLSAAETSKFDPGLMRHSSTPKIKRNAISRRLKTNRFDNARNISFNDSFDNQSNDANNFISKRSPSLSQLFSSLNKSSKSSVNSNALETELHRQAQNFVEEVDPTNIVRKDFSLNQDHRTFTHLPSQAEISIPVASAQYALNKNLNTTNTQDVTMRSLPTSPQSNVDKEHINDEIIKSISQSNLQKTQSPSPPLPSKIHQRKSKSSEKSKSPTFITLRNRSVKRRTTESIGALRKTLKEEKEKKQKTDNGSIIKSSIKGNPAHDNKDKGLTKAEKIEKYVEKAVK